MLKTPAIFFTALSYSFLLCHNFIPHYHILDDHSTAAHVHSNHLPHGHHPVKSSANSFRLEEESINLFSHFRHSSETYRHSGALYFGVSFLSQINVYPLISSGISEINFNRIFLLLSRPPTAEFPCLLAFFSSSGLRAPPGA